MAVVRQRATKDIVASDRSIAWMANEASVHGRVVPTRNDSRPGECCIGHSVHMTVQSIEAKPQRTCQSTIMMVMVADDAG